MEQPSNLRENNSRVLIGLLLSLMYVLVLLFCRYLYTAEWLLWVVSILSLGLVLTYARSLYQYEKWFAVFGLPALWHFSLRCWLNMGEGSGRMMSYYDSQGFVYAAGIEELLMLGLFVFILVKAYQLNDLALKWSIGLILFQRVVPPLLSWLSSRFLPVESYGILISGFFFLVLGLTNVLGIGIFFWMKYKEEKEA